MNISGPNKSSYSRLRFFGVLCASLLGLGHVGRAENFSNFYSDDTLTKAQPIFKEDMESLFKVIRRHLSPEENQKLGQVRLEFPLRTSDPLNPLNFYAETQERIIHLPVQTKVFLSDLTLAYVWLVANGYQPQTVFDYAGMVGHYSRKSISDRRPRQYFGGKFPLPLTALQIPKNAAQNSTVADNRDQKLTDAIMFGFCHELGHVFYQHPSYAVVSAETARANEAQADVFAVDILRRISRAPLGTVFFFLTVAHLNGSQGGLLETRTHPLTGERLQMLASAMEKEASGFAKNESDRETWSSNIRSLAGELKVVAMTFDGPLQANAVQVSNLRAENINERLAPRRTQTYLPLASSAQSTAKGNFSGIYDCNILLVQGLPPIQVRLVLRRDGATVKGEYSYAATGITGRLTGDIDGESLNFDWNEPPNLGFPARGGKGLFRSSNEGATMTGDWGRSPEKEGLGKWDAKRIGH